MSDNNPTFQDLYKALKADGAVQGDWNSFRKYVGAPGKQGYINRKKLYDALKADGAVSSPTYEDFHRKLYAAGKAQQQRNNAAKVQQQPSQPQTTAQKAIALQQQSKQQKQGGQAQQTAVSPSSSGTDYMANWELLHMRDSEMTPLQRAQANNMRTRMQNASQQQARQDGANPISRSRVNPSKAFHEQKAQQYISAMRGADKKNRQRLGSESWHERQQSFEEAKADRTFAQMVNSEDFSGGEAMKARAKQQLEDDARGLAAFEVGENKFHHNNDKIFGSVGEDIFNIVDSSMKEADELTNQQYLKSLDKIDENSPLGSARSSFGSLTGKMDLGAQTGAYKEMQTQRMKNRQDYLMKNMSARLQEIYSQKGMQRHIVESADKLSMSVEQYVDDYVTPEIMNYAQKALSIRNKEEIMPHGTLDYIAKNLSNTIVGMIVAPAFTTKETRQRLQEGIAIADGLEEMETVAGHKDKTFRSGAGTRFLSTAANMAADAPALMVTGSGSEAAITTAKGVLSRGLAKVGVTQAAEKLTAQQLGFKLANMTMAQKIGSGLLEGSSRSALNLGGYSSITSALGQMSTGDDTSLAAVGKAAVDGFVHGSETGGIFGLSGAVMAPWMSKFGINGTETSRAERMLHGAQKVGATAVGLGVEAGTMMVADNITGDKDISVGTWLEDIVTVGAFKAGEPKNYTRIGQALYGLTHNTSSTYRFGKDEQGNWRTVDIRMTKDEQNELINSTSGKNLMDAFKKVDKSSLSSKTPLDKSLTKQAYEDFMNDPNVSQSTKEKVNAAMGLFNTTRAKSFRSNIDRDNKQVLEYSRNGTLLSRTSYNSPDERDAIIAKQQSVRDNDELLSLVAMQRMKDRKVTDDYGNVTGDAIDFLKENGYDDSKEPTDPHNAPLISGLQDENSDLYRRWCKFADDRGWLSAISSDNSQIDTSWGGAIKDLLNIEGNHHDLFTVLAKDPMKRTDLEKRIAKACKDELQKRLFPDGQPHEEQSESMGRDVAEDNNLGTEQPNSQAVIDELNNLKEAEDNLTKAMESNDTFKQIFEDGKKQGMRNADIYAALLQNGVTADEAAPLAEYMNANARVQGMQQATQQKIEQNVSAFVDDWAFKGTYNGEKIDGKNVIRVQDEYGRVLIVANGDMAFDETNDKAKEGVGDLLICYDEQNKQTVYVRAEDVTLFSNEDAEAYKAKEIERLQNINSVPYNEAARAQAEADAAKVQQEGGEEDKPQDQGEGGKGNESKPDSSEQNYSLSEKKTSKGDTFYQDESGNINMAEIPEEVFNSIGYTKAPFRLTESMVRHILTRHGHELGISTPNEAIHFVRDVMANFDHVRLGNDGALVFSIENGRKKTGKRAITIFISEEGGDFYGLKTSGFENMKGLEKRPLLWERGVKNDSSSTATATVNVATNESQSSGEQSGNASNQSIGLGGKGTNNSSNDNASETTLTFKNGEKVPMKQDSKGRPAPDYDKMTPAQCAEVLHSQFKGSAEKVADARIKKAKEAVKKAEKIKVNYDAEDDADILEQETAKAEAIKAAQENLEKAEAVKKALTALQVDETLHPKNEGEEGKGEGGENPPKQANVASPEAAAKFQNAKRLQGYKRRRTLKDGTKVYGHYEIVPAESLTPSHDVFNGYKMSVGFPVDKNGHTINDRDYEYDKDAQNDTDLMARTYDGQAIDHVPTVSDEGIVYDGNGRTMAGQKAAKEGTDADYIEALMENAESFGFTKEQIEQSGIEHPRLVLVTDERLPYDTATFAKFNQNEKKTQSNTEKAVAKAKTLTPNEIGAIVAEVEGTGSLEAFFNNPKAINDLIKTLQKKKVLGHNEVAELLESEGKLSAQGKEYVKNLLLGSVFTPETIRMMGIDSKIKTKAVHGIRAIMDNMKLGEYSLRGEIDNAIKLFYEARNNGMAVDDYLLRQSSMFDENARDRFSPIEQAIAQAFEGNDALFRDLMREYNDVSKARNTGEASLFGENQTRDEFIDEFINGSETIKDNGIKLYGKEERAEGEGADNAPGNEKLAGETGEGAGEKTESQQQVDEAVKSIATEITKGTGVEVVTGEKAQEALDEAEASGTEIKKQRISAKGAVLDWGNIPKKARLNNDELTSIIMWNNSSYAGELDHLKEGEYIEHYVDANGYFYTFRVDKNHHIYMDEAIPKTSSANKERINELKNYYNEERARHLETVRSDRGETQSELGRSTDSDGSTVGARYSQDSTVGRGNERADSERDVERDTPRSKQSSSKIKQFRSKNGEVYGFTDGEKIYLDTKKMKPETPLHEYTHLWTEALKRANPKEWENVKKIFDEVEGLKEEVQKLYPELKGDDLYEEMITTYSGREGAKKLEEVVRELAAKEGKTVAESAKAQGFIGKVKEALQKYWKGVADMLHIHFTTAEEVADKVLADWAKGVNPNEIKGEEKLNTIDSARKAYEEAKKSGNEEQRTKAILDLKQAYLDKINSKEVKKKDEAWNILAEAEELLAEHRGLVYDEHSGSRINSATIDKILTWAESTLDKITDEPVDPATEKQEGYINKMLDAKTAGDDMWSAERAALEGMKYNKFQASKLIDRIKFLNNMDGSYTEDDIDRAEKEIRQTIDNIRERNGAKPFDWDKKEPNGKLHIFSEDGDIDKTFHPIEAAAEDFKKDHPMTEDEIMGVEGLDDESKYTAIDYLNGEDDSEVARICYEQAYNNRKPKNKPTENVDEHTDTVETSLPGGKQKVGDLFTFKGNTYRLLAIGKLEKGKTRYVTVGQIDENGDVVDRKEIPALTLLLSYKPTNQKEAKASGSSKPSPKSKPKVKTVQEKKADAKTFREERDKETSDLMQQFLAAANKKGSGSGKAYSTLIPIPSKAAKWMEKNLTLSDEQKVLLPKLLTAIKGSMYARIKEGVYNLEDVIENVRKDFKAFFSALSEDDANKILAEAAYKGRYTDPETKERMKLSEFAERERKLSPEHKANLFGDSKLAEEKKQKENTFIGRVKEKLDKEKSGGIRELRKLAEECGMEDVSDTDLQELAETAVVQKVRDIATSRAISNEKKFEAIKAVYENQPSLNQRDSERVMKQQYSTPAPYAFLADMYVTKGGKNKVESALEPSAGNGMLTIGLPKDKVHVNDIDDARLANLRRQGFKNISNQDGTQPFADKDVDVVVTNPPFGSATTKEYDGYKISSLEGQMAINALESMKDDGRAAIIIGGTTEYASNGSLKPKDKAFLGYLYSHYNVEDVINVDGSLYAKQGTTYPTRIILINGRRKFDPEHKVYPPVEKNARAETVKDYDELFKRINDDVLRSKDRPVDIRGEESGEGNRPSGSEHVSDTPETNGGRDGRMGTGGTVEGNLAPAGGSALDALPGYVEKGEAANGSGTGNTSVPDSTPDGGRRPSSVSQPGPTDGGTGRGDSGIRGANDSNGNDVGQSGHVGGVRLQSTNVQPVEQKKQTLTTEKVAYKPTSTCATRLGAVVPARQKEALDKVLSKLGDVDQYLVDNLGYNDKDDLHKYLAAEQIDSVALAIKQMEKGNGFIIGDQTGIGKGRQAASIIRYAIKHGRIPVSFTKTPELYSDTYRDLKDVGNPELRPFILASSSKGNIVESYDQEVKNADGSTTTVRKQRVVYRVPSKEETKRVLKYIAENGKLPEEYDYILTTYSQIQNGLEEFKSGKWKPKPKPTATDKNSQMKRDAIEKIAANSVFVLDESHEAAGQGSGSAFIQKVLPKVNGVTFLSATYAKTPEAMALYALKTDIGSKGKDESGEGSTKWKLLNAIKNGGPVFQEILSQALVSSGQLIRRERDMTGVTIDWKPLTENEAEIKEHQEKFDSIFGIFNDILNFQRTYVDTKLGEMSDELALVQGSADHRPGTKDMGIGNVTFASKAFNVVQQALFSIKAEKVADAAIEAIKAGKRPVIAVNNTLEGMGDEYPMGVEMNMPDLNTTLMKGLEGILRYTEKDDMGGTINNVLKVEELGEEAVARYNEIRQKILNVSSGLSISPIDVIKHRLEQAGCKVGELTGRNTEFVYNENGKVVRQRRTDKNKNALADRFNNGDINVLILNRTASTGISLHASGNFKNDEPRVMIFAQMQNNINDEVQMRGRIDRTGQVARGQYVYLVSSIPAEQRLMMMFKNKLKSLDANTTSSQKSKFNEVDVADITNKYGDEIALQYMAQHPEYYNKLVDPLGWGFMEYPKDGMSVSDLRRITSERVTSPAYEVMKRLTLLPVKEQETALKELSEIYSQKIQQLNDMGMNDLEITDMPLDAKTLKRDVWKEGSEPGGDNALTDNAYVETVEMNVLKKPMKAEEVQDSQKKMLGGKDWETWRTDKIAEIREAQKNKIADTKARMTEQMEKKIAKMEEASRASLEKQNARVQKKIDKGDELKPGEHIFSESEINTAINNAASEIKEKTAKKISDAVDNLNTKYEMFITPLYALSPDKTVSVPMNWHIDEAELSAYPEFGRVIGFKYDKNFNLGSSTVVIATADSRRRVEIPVARTTTFDRIQKETERFAKECKVVNMDAWDRMIPKKDRTTGHIITGNMLEALNDNSNIGHLISYTTQDGGVRQGILIPDGVSLEEITGKVAIKDIQDWITNQTNGTEVKSDDGKISLTKNWSGMYTLTVPGSRKEGGKYYLNKDLLDVVHSHNFHSKGSNFWASFDSKDLGTVLDTLDKMGVKAKTPTGYEPSSTHFREDNKVSVPENAPVTIKNIAEVSRKTGAKVNIVTSAEEVTNKQAKAAIDAGKKVTGWYDEKTGEVHLYMPNIHDSYTAEKTIWHETVGHKGMRELFGDKFDKFLDSVWYDLDRPENAKLKELVMDELKKNPFDYRNAIEEGVARLAEEGKGEPGFWRNIKNKLVDLMHEIGYRIAPNTKDVKYLLWLSKNLQKHPNDVSWRLKADAVKYKLDKESTPDVITRDGIFRDNDGKTHSSDLAEMPKKEYQEATDGQVHFRTAPSLGTAIDRYHRALNAHGYMATESFMDNMLSLDKLMRAIDPSIKKIEDVESSRNPYILQNTMQGAMSNAAEQFEMHVMKPLDKAMADLLEAFDGRETDDMIRNFNLYMITKHGLERNRVFFVRDYIKGLEGADAKSLQSQWNAEKKDLGDKLNNGSIDLKGYYDEMDEWIRNNVDKDYDASENDYSGLHGVQGIEDGKQPYDDAEAIDSVMSAEAKMEGIKAGSVKDFWSKVRTATDFALESDYKNGIVSKDNHDNVSAMFDWYVPLRKFDKDTAEDVYGYVTEKGDPSTYIGSTLMNAKGRKSLSETNVLAQIGAMGNAAINRGGQNAIKQAFMRFIRANSGNGLVTESKVWAVQDGTDASGNPIWREAYPDIPEDAAPDEIAKIVSDFEIDMKAKQALGDAKVIRNHRDVKFKFERAKDANQHVVDVMVNGSTVRFYVNGNPRAAQALNGMLENQGTKWLKPVASITRIMAQLCTSYSPEFVVRNIVRDAEFAFSNIAAKENSSYRRTWEKYYVGLIGKGIGSISFGDLKGSEGLGLYAKYNNGTLDMSNKVHRYFKEFMENGGETGWVQVLSMKDWEKKYKTDIKTERSKINKGGEILKDFFLGNLKNINEAAENMARFATYCASRDAGRSAVRSAYDAKEVSTNFNRHGSGDRIWDFKNGSMSSGKAARQKTYGFLASYLRQCSMFFNAGIQSTNLLMKNYKHAAKGAATVMTGIPFAMGIAAALVNNWLIASEDEKERKGVKDPYGELPEYVRRNNLCIYKGNGEFVTIPLAIELRAFYGVGDLVAGLTFSKNIKTTRPAWADAVGCLSQLVPIMDYTNSHTVDNSPFNETLKAFSPSAFAPLVEWGLNSDWKGAPIRREKASYNEYAPAWTRAYKNTPKVFMDMNKKANAMTNDLDEGNENLLGWNALDAATDPSAWNHFLGGFGGGMATFATRVTKLATSVSEGQKPETSDIPFVRSFLYEPNEQSSIARTKSKWYNYVEDMEKDVSNIKTLKKRTVPVDQLVHNYAAYYKIKNSPKAQKAQVIEQAENQMKQLKQMRDKSSDPAAIDNANKTIDNIMMRAVEQLDQLSSAE